MIYITGDIHGNTSRVEECGKNYGLTEKDTLIIAGDFGCIFGQPYNDEKRLDSLAALPFMILFLDGNHECFPQIYSYPEEQWNGGRIHRIRKNILHLMRGQVFTLNGITVFTMGGGYSIDMMYRIPGRSWWPEELPSEAEYTEAWKNLKKHDNSVDVIVSHAAPDETMRMFEQTGVISSRFPQEMKLNRFLENVLHTVRYKHYYFGHMHLDSQLPHDQVALYYDVYRMDTGEHVEPQNVR